MRTINEIILHYTETKHSIKISLSDVRKWHKARGFSDVGYHYLILQDGRIEVGRDLNTQGAHCAGRNKNSVGIAYVGGLEDDGTKADTRTLEQIRSLDILIGYLRRIYGNIPVSGHNDYSEKECPGFDAKAEYND